MKKKSLKRLTALGLASLLLSGTVLSQTVHAEENQAVTTAQFKVQRDGSQSIVGKTTPNTRLRIEHNGIIKVEDVSDSDGNYELKIPDDKKYVNFETISISSVDSENIGHWVTSTYADLQAPEIIDNGSFYLEEGDTYFNLVSYDSASVTVLLSDGSEVSGIKDDNDRWIFNFPAVRIGQKIKFRATDFAGNSSEKELIVKEMQAPSAYKSVDDENQYIKGESYPNATVYVRLPDGTELSTIADDGGNYKFTITENHFFYEEDSQPQVWAVRGANLVSSRVGYNETFRLNAFGYGVPARIREDRYYPKVRVKYASNTYVEEGTIRLILNTDGSQTLKYNYYTENVDKVSAFLPDGTEIKAKQDDTYIVFSIPVEKSLKQNELVRIKEKTPHFFFNETFKAITNPTALPQVNELKVGATTIGGQVEKQEGIGIRLLHVTLPSGTVRDIKPDSYGNWILSIPELKKDDIVKVTAEDHVGNISEPRIIKVGSGEVKSIHETGQANIQAELPEFPIKDVPELDKPKENTPSTNADGKEETKPSENKKEPTLPSYSLESETKVNGVGNQSQQQPNVSGVETSNSTTKQVSTDDGSGRFTKNSGKGQNNSQTTKKTNLPKTGERTSTLALLAGFVIMGLSIFTLKGKKSK